MFSEIVIFGSGLLLGGLGSLCYARATFLQEGSSYEQITTSGGYSPTGLNALASVSTGQVVKAPSQEISLIEQVIASVHQSPRDWKQYDRCNNYVDRDFSSFTGAVNKKADVKVLKSFAGNCRINDIPVSQKEYKRIIEALTVAQLGVNGG